MFDKFKDAVHVQKRSGLYRNPPRIHNRHGQYVTIGNRKVLNFASNDYLGLGFDEKLRQRVASNFMKYGTSSSSSRLVSGNYAVINEAEAVFADYFGYEDAIFFPSGYQANLAVFSTLFDRDSILFFDKHVHASCVKGMSLSRASLYGYNHGSMDHLRRRIERVMAVGAAVVTESLFSMDGDFLDTKALLDLKKEFDLFCVVDEAHAFGVSGERGKGIAGDVASVAIGTLGKAFGLFGAFVLLSSALKEYFFNFSSPLIYTTALPEAHAASAVDSLETVSLSDDRRVRLKDVSAYMKGLLTDAGFHVTGDAHIVSVLIGDESLCSFISERLLQEKAILVLSARYPTVPVNRAILRIGMTALHTEKDARYFVNSLKEVQRHIEKQGHLLCGRDGHGCR